MRSGLIITLLLIYFTGTLARLEPIPNGILEKRISLSKCIGNATERFFQKDEVVLVSLSIMEHKTFALSPVAMDRLLFYEVFSRSSLSVIITNILKPRLKKFYKNKIQNYVIQVRNENEIKENLNALEQYPTWNSQAKFLVVSSGTFQKPKEFAAEIIQQLWSKKVVNGVVFLANPENDTIFTAYSWLPFSENHCRSGFDEVQVIDECSYGRFETGQNWFPCKVARNLNQCSIRVRAVVWPPYVLKSSVVNATNLRLRKGIEIKIMNTIGRVANFSVNYTVSDEIQDWGSVYENGTATKALLDLKNEEYDIVVGSFAATPERHFYFDSVTYNIPESLTWCVPHAEDTYQWRKLLMVIPPDIWFWCSVTYLVVSICLWGLCLAKPTESNFYRKLPNCLLTTFAILVNLSVKIRPRTLSVRLAFLLWAYFSLHIVAIYQTSLISVLAKPKYQQKIKTIQDAFDKNLGLWCMRNAKRYFREEDDWLNQKIADKWRDCDDIAMCLNLTAFDKDSATCTPRLFMKYAVAHYVTDTGRPLLYCFKDSIVTYPLEMFLVKGFPLKAYFEQLVGRITAAGLIAHWEKRIFDFQMQIMTFRIRSSNGYKLTLADLALPFIILAIGYVTAFSVFLFEIYLRKLDRKKKLK